MERERRGQEKKGGDELPTAKSCVSGTVLSEQYYK